MTKSYFSACLLSFIFLISISTIIASCQSKSDSAGNEPAQQPNSSTEEEFQEKGAKMNYGAFIEGDWVLHDIQHVNEVQQKPVDEGQKVMADSLGKVFKSMGGVHFDGITNSFRAYHIQGEYEVDGDIIHVSGTQRGTFGMVSLKQTFKVFYAEDDQLAIATYDGMDIPASNMRVVMDAANYSGSPLGFKDLLIYLKRKR